VREEMRPYRKLPKVNAGWRKVPSALARPLSGLPEGGTLRVEGRCPKVRILHVVYSSAPAP